MATADLHGNKLGSGGISVIETTEENYEANKELYDNLDALVSTIDASGENKVRFKGKIIGDTTVHRELENISKNISELREEMNNMGFPNLDYSHPLVTQSASYTCTQECYGLGFSNNPDASQTARVYVNGAMVGRGGYGSAFDTGLLKFNAGDVLTGESMGVWTVFPLK